MTRICARANDSVPNSDESIDTWPILEVIVEARVAEMVADHLWSMGVAAIEETAAPSPGLVVLRTSLGMRPDDLVAGLVASFPEATCEVRQVPRTVTDTWRQFADSVRVDDDTYFVPAWIDAPSARLTVRIEPADQFGLGNHPTTLLAARLALRVVTSGDVVLDLGCGTGVLALACVKATGCRSFVTDIAPGSRAVVDANRRLNEIEEDAVSWVDGLERLEDASITVSIANILAPVLRELAPDILRVTAHGGTVILSGVRDEQLSSVLEYYPACEVVARESSEGWTAVSLRHRA